MSWQEEGKGLKENFATVKEEEDEEEEEEEETTQTERLLI